MNAQGSSRTVLFDVGGVLVDSHPDPHIIAEMLGDGSRALTSLVDQAIWTHRGDYDAGLPDREFWDRIAGDCGKPEPTKELLSALVALDASRMATANGQTLGLVRQLRQQGVRVGILSNAPYPIAKAIRRSEWGRLFDFFSFSCDYGICKPARGIYRDVLHRINTPYEQVVFIDDRRENVRAAELMGVQGIVWKGVEHARERLEQLGFLA
ncbi:haloacid dehalogenase [Schaalia meyeri]|uniref:HAD family hydrolase n=1 Tax=Schaalia meyeri TaxID=52773 RepID=UPI00068368D7|nr:HAD family phosphatase [Schaalia meyeri]AKU65643.1 haloacid dehalogenase [Schaalia meyeri]